MTYSPTRRALVAALLSLPFAPARAAELVELWRLYAAAEEGQEGYVTFSDLARELDGRPARFRGYMAPPLMAETNFFVLGDYPMSVCPFCDTEAEWPADILAVYAKRVVEVVPFWEMIEVRGVLRIGAFTDPDTDFLSMVRLEDAVYARV